MDKKLDVGDEVLIFKYISEWGINQNYEHFIKGNIIKKEMSDDLSYHGSPWYKMNYTVLGEDGQKYFGNYKIPHLGGSFFMTKEDYIDHLKMKIADNKEKMLEIKRENKKLQKLIEDVQMENTKESIELTKTKKIGTI